MQEQQLYRSGPVELQVQERSMLVFRLALKEAEGLENETNPFDEVKFSPLGIMLVAAKNVVSDHFIIAKTEDFPYGACYNPGENGTTHEVLVYFPSITISEDPIYTKLLKELSWKLNEAKPIKQSIFGEPIWDPIKPAGCYKGVSYANVSFNFNPRPIEFKKEYNSECEEITLNDIQASKKQGITQNNLILVIDRFDLLIRHFQLIDKKHNKSAHNHQNAVNKQKETFFKKNLRYVSSAFYWSRKINVYGERSEDGIDISEWLSIAKGFDVSEAIALDYYKEANEYAYTVVTLEEIIKRESKESREMISNYNEDRFRYMVKDLIKNEHRSAADIGRCFAEFVRKDHFYADGSIYVMDENCCRKCEPHELRPVVDKFCSYVREGQITIGAECLEIGETMDIAKVLKSIKEIITPFTGDSADRKILSACKNYLHTTIKTKVRQTCIPFRDVVAVYDPTEVVIDEEGNTHTGTLRFRKAFMEDQFTQASPIPILGFGNSEEDRQAIRDVRETLHKMIANEENIKWFIKWMGSLFTHRPERVCTILYGPKGGNAKTTLSGVLVRIFGPTADNFMPTIMQPINGNNGHTDAQMKMKDLVLMTISEPEGGTIYSSSTIKATTGGDPFTGSRKGLGTETFIRTAKPLILCNEVPGFDKIDTALLDRLFIIRCPGRFRLDADPDPVIQRQQHIYPIDHNFWNERRIRALLHIAITEGYPNYVKYGLLKTPHQIKELNDWNVSNDEYAKFAEIIQETYQGEKWYTETTEVYAVFKQKHPRFSANLNLETFKAAFHSSTGYKAVTHQGTQYYQFYHRDCIRRFSSKDLGIN
jgi:hypothetical protein